MVLEVVIVVGFTLLLGVGVWPLFSFWSQRRLHVKKAEQEEERNPNNIPDGSMGWPFLGETLAYLSPHPSHSIGQFLEQHSSRYGKVFKSHLFGGPAIVSCDPEMSTFILQNEGKLFSSSYPKAMQGVLGHRSILLASGDRHRKLRSIAVSFIATSKSSPHFLHFLNNFSTSLIQSLNQTAKLRFLPLAKQFALHVMLKNLIDMEPEDPVALIILKDFHTFMKGFISLPFYLPGTPFAKAVKARKRITSTLRVIMEERKNRKTAEGSGSCRRRSRRDFMDEILEKEQLNDEERVSIITDLLLGGYETTSGLIALIVYFLSHSPQALGQLREEHQDIKRKKGKDEPLNMEDYKQMEFTMKVIYEALRCGNMVKFLHRKALEDVKFKGYLIPRGWKVLPVLSATHLDPSLHQDPSLFDPSRWEDEATMKKLMAFGGGSRLCPGAELAKVEISFFLHHFILNYSWKIKEDEGPVSFPYLDFKRGMLMEIQPLRNDNA